MSARGTFLILLIVLGWAIVVGIVYALIATAHAVTALFGADGSIAIAATFIVVCFALLLAIFAGAVLEGRNQYEPVEVSDGEGE